MANLKTARFSLTGMGTVRSLGERLEDRWITVKDFGATGDGSTDDTAAIQATFDYAYGAEGDPHGRDDADLNKVVFFPRGRYKISAPLQLNNVYGATLIGTGSHQSRIFWSGAAVEGEAEDHYPVIECRNCWGTHMEGLTFDASGVQNVVMHVTTLSDVHLFEDGSDGYYRDIHITGAVRIGGLNGHGVLMGFGGYFASERTWVKCKFTDCEAQGYRILHQNALNHEFYGCVFADCEFGIRGVTGHSITVSGCWFENNSSMDIRAQVGTAHIENCHSTSRVFASVSGTLIGNTHINASEGEFFAGFNDFTRDYMNTDLDTGRLIGNHSTNGIVKMVNNLSSSGAYLTGNLFENPGYIDDTADGPSPRVFVDGVQVLPP